MAIDNSSIKPKRAHNFIDLTDKKFGRLKVLYLSGIKNRQAEWFCECECGEFRAVVAGNLKNGNTNSCGCFMVDQTKKANTRHGFSKRRKVSSIYIIYTHIIDRCYNPKSVRYLDYGGRGIGMCDEWRNSFIVFYENVGDRPSKLHSLDRINNSKGYEPGNVRWATAKEQSRNTRKNINITYMGETKCASEWAERVGLNPSLIAARYRKGWCAECVLTKPTVNTGIKHICTHNQTCTQAVADVSQ